MFLFSNIVIRYDKERSAFNLGLSMPKKKYKISKKETGLPPWIYGSNSHGKPVSILQQEILLAPSDQSNIASLLGMHE